VISKLFNEAKVMGLLTALPLPWQDATPESLAGAIRQGKYTFNRVLQLRNNFMRASEKLAHHSLDLRRVLEEIITEGLLLKESLQSEFD
jgi:hypothetical protein